MEQGYGKFPRIRYQRENNNASNNYWRILINPDHPWYGAQLAQERYEFIHKWKWTAILVALAGLALYLIHPYATPLALLTPLILRHSKFLEPMEITGHTIEAVAGQKLYGHNLETHMRKEAYDLTHPNSSYREKGLFKKQTTEQVYKKMVEQLDDANKWVIKHTPIICKDIEKVKNI